MAKPPKKSPGVGHNSLASHEAINLALAKQFLMDQEMDSLKEKHKRARAGFEGTGVILGQIDKIKKLAGQPVAAIEKQFREDFHYAGAMYPDLYEQFDIFAPKAEAPERRAAHYHVGKMSALRGEPNTPPPGVTGDDLQRWQKGYNDHLPLFEKAKAEILAEAIENAENGKVTDGTGGKAARAARAVRTQAAADFKADNPGVDLGEAAGSGVKGEEPSEEAQPPVDGEQAPATPRDRPPAEPAPEKPLSQSEKAAAKRAAAKVH